MSAAIDIAGGYNNVVLKNNIASGMQYGLAIERPDGHRSDPGLPKPRHVFCAIPRKRRIQ